MNQSFYPGEDLASHFPLKAALSIFFLALVHHAFMFLCFSLLVLADLLSRWIAISAALLRAEGKSEATLLSMIRAIPRARRLGLICSSVMKEQGLSKLILYNLCVLVSACADYLLSESGFPSAMAATWAKRLNSRRPSGVMPGLPGRCFRRWLFGSYTATFIRWVPCVGRCGAWPVRP